MPCGTPERDSSETPDRIRPGWRLLVPLPVRFAGYASSGALSSLKTVREVDYYSSSVLFLTGHSRVFGAEQATTCIILRSEGLAGDMTKLNIKAKRECMWDLVSLGEVMLRLDPGDERISTTRHFRAWEGGGEYNVARGLKRCFGMDAAIVTTLADNPVGRLVEDLMLQGGVSQKYVRWAPFDGVGRTVRNGLNFTERGFGVRPALGCPDRGHTAGSQMKAGDIDLGGIFCGGGGRSVFM